MNGISNMKGEKDMFDEKSGIWIKIYKAAVIVLLFVCGIGGFVVGTTTRTVGLGYFLCVIGGVAVGFIQYILGMLIVNFFSNVQSIREHLEKR
ncbi:MAG: hypothetical protein ACLSTO_11540 [Bilophila wadsworthia]